MICLVHKVKQNEIFLKYFFTFNLHKFLMCLTYLLVNYSQTLRINILIKFFETEASDSGNESTTQRFAFAQRFEAFLGVGHS